MFGLPTFPKLLFVAAIIAAVWYFLRRGQFARKNAEEKDERPAGGRSGNARPIEDMVQCKSCGAYYPAKSTCSCGHSAG